MTVPSKIISTVAISAPALSTFAKIFTFVPSRKVALGDGDVISTMGAPVISGSSITVSKLHAVINPNSNTLSRIVRNFLFFNIGIPYISPQVMYSSESNAKFATMLHLNETISQRFALR
jgi:hypothetical protein